MVPTMACRQHQRSDQFRDIQLASAETPFVASLSCRLLSVLRIDYRIGAVEVAFDRRARANT